jgi:hypothetical protein
MRIIALILGVGMLAWSADMCTDLLLGGHQPWSTTAGIALGGIGWIVASIYVKMSSARSKFQHESMFNGLTRIAGDSSQFAPTQLAPDAQKAIDDEPNPKG